MKWQDYDNDALRLQYRTDLTPGVAEHVAHYQKWSEEVVVALSSAGELWGAVVYFSNMQDYSSGGPDFDIANASGIRLLAVDPTSRDMGVGKSLTNACIKLALDNKHKQIFLHSTKLMKVAWAMYEKMGFERSTDLDFNLHGLSIYGFRLAIEDNA